MSKYFQAMQRGAPTKVMPRSVSTEVLAPAENGDESAQPAIHVSPAVIETADIIGDLARDGALCRLSEQLAALGAREEPVRLLVSGCRPGDGASTVAAALALDLSQRLAMRTVLVEGHLRHPALRNLLARFAPMPADLSSASSLSSQRTAWPRLELISRRPGRPVQAASGRPQRPVAALSHRGNRPGHNPAGTSNAGLGAPDGPGAGRNQISAHQTRGTPHHRRRAARNQSYRKRRDSKRKQVTSTALHPPVPGFWRVM